MLMNYLSDINWNTILCFISLSCDSRIVTFWWVHWAILTIMTLHLTLFLEVIWSVFVCQPICVCLLSLWVCRFGNGIHFCYFPVDAVFTGGGGGFFLASEDFGRMCNLFPTSAFFFFFKVEIRSCTLIPLLRPGSVHSGLASWEDCGWVFPDELHVSSFHDRFPHYACTVA